MAGNDDIKSSNVLKIGTSTMADLTEKVKAFRTMNLKVKKRRFLISRENILDQDKNVVVKKGEDIDISKTMLLRRIYKADHEFKTFQPDEGIVLISDMTSPAGISLSMDLVTQVMNIGGGAYEAFIDRVDSFEELHSLLQKALFPKMVIVGYIPLEKLKNELAYYNEVARVDPFLRFIEILHTQIKPMPILPRLRNVTISPEDRDSWKRFIIEVVQEYTKPYSIEER